MRAFALDWRPASFSGTWITRTISVYGGLQLWVAVLVNGALIAYMALFPAIFAVVMRRLVFSLGAGALMTAPLVWVTTELGRTHLFTGFPWVLLGYSQVTMLPIAQLASVFGVYGVSALVASVSAAAALVAAGRVGRVGQLGPAKAGHYVPAVASVAAVVLLVAVWGSLRAAKAEWTRTGEPIQVGLIQGNVDQAEKWNADRATAILQKYLNMSRQAIGEGSEFVLWPESRRPFSSTKIARRQIARWRGGARVPILPRVRSDRTLPARQVLQPAFCRRRRMMPHLPQDAPGAARRHVPLKRLFYFAPRWSAAGDFSAGDGAFCQLRI